MSNTPELDRAIEAAAASIYREDVVIQNCDRIYARALVAELLRDMDEPPLDPPAILGWDLAIQIIKRRAGLEGEG